eukprot:ctg_505.g187
MPAPADALTAADVRQLTYDQVKGTGLANRCPEVTSSKGKITLDKSHKYKVVDMCLEPKQFMVEEEISRRKGEVKKEFVDTKLLTRASYSLGNVEGELVNEGGGWKFIEKEGMDYMATTVQLPGGERVPFLFTIKKLVASLTNADEGISASTEFGGDFTVPNYRTGMFLDPKGRGIAAGYDMAVALPALEADGGEGQDELQRENDKRFDVGKGSIEFAVNKVDPSTNEIGGVFVSEQPSDTDMGAKAPKRLLLKATAPGRGRDEGGGSASGYCAGRAVAGRGRNAGSRVRSAYLAPDKGTMAPPPQMWRPRSERCRHPACSRCVPPRRGRCKCDVRPPRSCPTAAR